MAGQLRSVDTAGVREIFIGDLLDVQVGWHIHFLGTARRRKFELNCTIVSNAGNDDTATRVVAMRERVYGDGPAGIGWDDEEKCVVAEKAAQLNLKNGLLGAGNELQSYRAHFLETEEPPPPLNLRPASHSASFLRLRP